MYTGHFHCITLSQRPMRHPLLSAVPAAAAASLFRMPFGYVFWAAVSTHSFAVVTRDPFFQTAFIMHNVTSSMRVEQHSQALRCCATVGNNHAARIVSLRFKKPHFEVPAAYGHFRI